jgi:hypothetical protein
MDIQQTQISAAIMIKKQRNVFSDITQSVCFFVLVDTLSFKNLPKISFVPSFLLFHGATNGN